MGYFNTAEGQAWKNQANPYAGQVSNLQNVLAGFNAGDPSKSTGIWGTYQGYKAPDISDPRTIAGMAAYRNMMQGDMARSTADYVRRAATAGAQRGGMALGGVAPQESALHLAAIRDIAGQSTALNQGALDYLTNKNKWDYSLQRNTMSDWLAGQNAINSALGQQAAWDTQKMKTLYGAWNDTPGAIMRGATYSDSANDQARQMQQQQAQQQQAVNANELWKNATYGNVASGDAAMLPMSNKYYSYLMGAPTRRG
jgi:hypothetical protein